ncbi:NYN domain-containing protein [Synechocystis salina LEGE 06099]|uniref:NYN domain-containing protein n=1 Tax=Synechocystis salina TaxID=945780 RepID=UPI001881A7D0|nr:NYN domain-containing protein [Synechocystis salina]MBE9202251.1 NYN domain-containing protein [Synechocystis salina LEGE 06099]
MPQSESNIALLIDADNAPASKIEAIVSEIAKYGVANIRKAYGNWKSPNLKAWEECLHEYAIRPVQQFDYTKGKNATDAAMIIDAMDLLYTQRLDAFAIVSSDCDFTPLVMRILTNGLKVYGFGEKKTPLPFVYACSTFLYLESIDQIENSEGATQNSTSVKKTGKELKQDAKLISLLRSAISSTIDDDGWSSLAEIGGHIKNQASFDSRNYGYAKLSSLFEAIDLFEIERKNRAIYVRNKQKNLSYPSLNFGVQPCKRWE